MERSRRYRLATSFSRAGANVRLRSAATEMSSNLDNLAQPLLRGFQYPTRKRLVVDRPRENQCANHAGKRYDRLLVATRGSALRHQAAEELEHLLQLYSERLAHRSRLPVNVATQSRDQASLPVGVAMRSRQVVGQNIRQGLFFRFALRRSSPDAPGPGQCKTHCLGHDR